MQFRLGTNKDDVAAAAQIDASLSGTHARTSYLQTISERGGLTLAVDRNQIVGFCCLDDHYFFERAFISLLIVDAKFRRRGIGRSLLDAATLSKPEVWTSTNRSNLEMRSLLDSSGWKFCGEIDGLDDGDPEMIFRKLRPAG
ncbi:MAG: GNAT family N-acetyltransferase [Pseudomonadota bacterium]